MNPPYIKVVLVNNNIYCQCKLKDKNDAKPIGFNMYIDSHSTNIFLKYFF
jgi:hypothetical protein